MQKINKASLASLVHSKEPIRSESDINQAITTVFEEIATALTAGDRVELRGFGSMVVRKREAKTVRNPRTNEKIEIEDKGSLYFRPSRQLIKHLNR